MPEDSRVWVYQSSRELSDAECAEISASIVPFLDEWTAHKQALRASFRILYNRFIIFLIDEKAAMASGCSIDKSVQFVRNLENSFSLKLLDRMQIAFRKDDTLSVLSKSDFEKKIQSGEVNANTIVFNNLVVSKSELEQHWEVPLKDSWHRVML